MTFSKFYHERRGFPPFPWMLRLAERFAANDLPDVIDLPTGSGKSDLTLIWSWARQQNAGLPRRLWMISDRRVIVDQTYEVAKTLDRDGVLVSRLRGGIASETAAILDPVAEQVITATVDQFGSRLLFRGYGSGPRSWPIWAGLAGNDSLVVLDEAHLSPNAEDTFRACCRMKANIRIISMTATPRACDTADRFNINEEDRAHPVLGRRLQAKRFVELRGTGSLEQAASEFLAEGKRRIALVCNTVREARRVFEAVQHPDKYLIIGRQRPLDRDRILEELLPRVRSGAEESEPLVVVATQCVEAGADFDFDAMATEACPIDALRQRLGRLDRLGNMGESRCVMLKPPAGREGVPPYGLAPYETWKWLNQHAKKNRIDLGAEGWAIIDESIPESARSSEPGIITFLEPHLRMLSRTSPRPRVEPDVDLLLHGPKTTAGAVTLVWRRDILERSFDDPTERIEATNEILQLVPPSSVEGCEVPLREAQLWLSHQTIDMDVGDVEGGKVPSVEDGEIDSLRRVICWRGKGERISLLPIDQLLPGMVIVLRSDAGGYDKFGWKPDSISAVEDLGDEAFMARTARIIQRVARNMDGDDPETSRRGFLAHRWRGGIVFEQLPEGGRSRIVEVSIPLRDHSERVADQADVYAKRLGIQARSLYDAGLYHDHGKAHPDWQLLVNGGDPRKLQEPPLAKGPYSPSPLSRLPRGWRHEAESLARLPKETDELVQWLVATHHGHARPFWPIPEHGVGLADMMDRLQRTHGYWGLALHEAVLRCADRKVSVEETGNA